VQIWQDTLDLLREKQKESDEILLAFSGGKDSLVCLDLCSRVFKTVKCFFMHFVPNLKCTEDALDYARARYNVSIVQYPHWVLIKCLKEGVYCDEGNNSETLPDWTLRDVYDLAKADAQTKYIVTGAKDADSLWRRRFFTTTKHWSDLVYPIRKWNKLDVLAYCKVRNIPVPKMSTAASATGVDLSTPSLLFVHQHFPEDFKRLLKWFPYAEAVVKRQEFYG
jgi:phosphoadenosine phosphosulfate reductase